MKNVRITVYLMTAILFTAAGRGFCTVEFKDGGTHNINYTINDNVFIDSCTPGMYTKVNLLSGGSVSNSVWACEDSQVTMSGGYVVFDLAVFQNGSITVSGGTVKEYLQSLDTSSLTMSDGNVNTCFAVTGHSNAILSGGWVSLLRAQENCHLSIYGGSSDRGLDAWGYSTTTFYGRNFQLGSGLTLDGNRILGTGILSGQWLNGKSWAMTIRSHDSTATILIPEPATLLLLVFGGLALPRKRRK